MEKSVILIKTAKRKDSGIINELGRQSFQETFAKDNSAENMQQYLEENYRADKIKLELVEADSLYFIAFVDNSPAGFAKLRKNSSTTSVTGHEVIELQRLYIIKKYHGLGVGSALMEKCLTVARQGKFDTIWLGVWEHNKNALRFYHKWNFSVVGSHEFILGEDIQKDLIMSLALAEKG